MCARRRALFILAWCGSGISWLCGLAVGATLPWPAEPAGSALLYTNLDPDFDHDMSGACWDPFRRIFWVCCNSPGIFWSLSVSPSGVLSISSDAQGRRGRYAVGGDLESICQADLHANDIFVLSEPDLIRQYRMVQLGTAQLVREWDISPHLPAYQNGLGPEGLTFVPDGWLREGQFVDPAGQPRLSRNGLGGLFFVAHQNGGRLYVFDIAAAASSVTFVGAFPTSRTESSGLEFDRDTGLLHIWHNTGPNYLEVVELRSTQVGSERRLNQVAEYLGPYGGNLEGLAPTWGGDFDGACLLTDDGNTNGRGVQLYRQFRSPAPLHRAGAVHWSLFN